MTDKLLIILMTLCFFIAGCGGQAHAGAIGDPLAGKALFQQTTIREAPACSTCHSTEPGKVIVGPSLAGVASRAEKRIPGASAEAYLRASITKPNSFIVEGFPRDIMYSRFQEVLTDAEINNLLAYLLTLK